MYNNNNNNNNVHFLAIYYKKNPLCLLNSLSFSLFFLSIFVVGRCCNFTLFFVLYVSMSWKKFPVGNFFFFLQVAVDHFLQSTSTISNEWNYKARLTENLEKMRPTWKYNCLTTFNDIYVTWVARMLLLNHFLPSLKLLSVNFVIRCTYIVHVRVAERSGNAF